MRLARNIKQKYLLLSLTLLIASCGGGSGVTTEKDTTAPTVSSTTPLDAATSVLRTSTVTATFDEDIIATTVDDSSFTLANTSNTDGTVSFDAITNITTFTPNNNLALMSTYTATLSTTITDLAGNALASSYSWSFTTADGAWGSAETIDKRDNGVNLPSQIAIDASGNVIAVWRQNDGVAESILSNRYEPGNGWDSPVVPLEAALGVASYPQVAFDSSGNAIAVWRQHDGSVDSVYANYYAASTGSWGGAILIENSSNSASQALPQIAFGPSGNAIAVWTQQDDDNTERVYANNFTASTTSWGTSATPIDDGSSDVGYHPQIAFDSSGNAFVVWDQSSDDYQDIWRNLYSANTGWLGAAELLQEAVAGDAMLPKIATDDIGNAIVVWEQYDGTRWNILAQRYKTGDGWGSSNYLESGDFDAKLADIALDASGNAIAIWSQKDGSDQSSIWTNRFTVGTGWGSWDSADLLETSNAGDATNPKIAADPSGNAIAVWRQYDGTRYNIEFNRYVPDIGWSGTDKIETDDDYHAFRPEIAVNSIGNAIAVWRQSDGTATSVWAKNFE